MMLDDPNVLTVDKIVPRLVAVAPPRQGTRTSSTAQADALICQLFKRTAGLASECCKRAIALRTEPLGRYTLRDPRTAPKACCKQ